MITNAYLIIGIILEFISEFIKKMMEMKEMKIRGIKIFIAL